MMLLAVSGLAQGRPSMVKGVVLDQRSSEPVPYATVAVYETTTSELITGTTTDETGQFSTRSRSANVFLTVSFIGYMTDTIRGLEVANGVIDAGQILLAVNQELLEEAVITGEISRTTFELDKRVFTVGKDLSTTGASALDVLNNVPSVNVNIEGEISLRGSTGVQILIDGKPSVLSDGNSNALGTITADMIESVEVITNPSAKYDAAGTSGILNIVLKKEEKKGLNGSISLNTGWPQNHSIGVSVNRRTQRFNLFAQGGAGYRSLPRYSESVNIDRVGGSTIESEGDAFRNEVFYNITLGADYHINELNVLTLSGKFAYEIEDSPSRTDFSLLDGDDVVISRWLREEDTQATNPKWQFDLQYKKEFADNEDHTLMISGLGSFFGKDQSSTFSSTTTSGEEFGVNQLTATNFQRADYTMKLDYVQPLTEKITIETGAQYELNEVGNDYSVRDFDAGEYVLNENLTNDFLYDQKVLGVYGTASYEGKKAGIKLGLRMENTDLATELVTTDEKNHQNYTNLFPSGHASYKATERLSFQVGYSKRVSRPRLWDLNPFFNITNNFNIRTGNPNLQPEFTDSYEVTSILILDKISLNGSIYHRFTREVIERVSTLEDNVNTTTPENIGTNGTTGFELNGKYNVAKWFTLTGDFNLNYFERRGEFQGRSFDFNGDRWNGQLTTKFKLPKDFEFEVTGNYESGYQTVQGNISGFAFADAGIRKKFLKGKIVANVGVRDLFASRKFESVIDQTDFYLYSFSQRGRFITFGVSYGFGKGEAMSYSGGGRRH